MVKNLAQQFFKIKILVKLSNEPYLEEVKFIVAQIKHRFPDAEDYEFRIDECYLEYDNKYVYSIKFERYIVNENYFNDLVEEYERDKTLKELSNQQLILHYFNV